MKKKSSLFNVPMRLYDKVEVCNVICIYILSVLWETYDITNARLQRENGLEVFKNIGGPQEEKIVFFPKILQK